MFGVFFITHIFRGLIQEVSVTHAARSCWWVCAMVFIAMAVADKCVIRIHYLRGYGDEAMKSLHLNALSFITVFVAVQMPNG